MKFSSEFASKDVPTFLPNSAKVVQKEFELVRLCFWFQNVFPFCFKNFRGGVIRISPYSSYPYIVYITYSCIVRPSLVLVVFQTTLETPVTFVFQLCSCSHV